MEMRSPTTKDAPGIWRLVRESGVLDPNSAYLYLLLCRDFPDTCLVAYRGETLAGFVTGYCPPRESDVLFIWQIGVAPAAQRKGVALAMLCELVRRTGPTSLCATVSPSNTASRRLFSSLARRLGAPLVDQPDQGFDSSDFPQPGHEAEPRIQIGPIP